jgi:hypothetical protein
MTATNTVWKIVDESTGLFWNGYKSECNDKIGTRFTRRSSLDDTIAAILRKYKGTFPPTWQVQKIQLIEHVENTMDAKSTRIDALIDENFPEVLSKRGCSSHVPTGARLFRKLRQENWFDVWPYIGLRRPQYRSSWPKFSENMRNLSIHVRSEVKAFPNGWVMFASKDTMMAAKLADMMDHVFDINDLREDFAKRIKAKLEDV